MVVAKSAGKIAVDMTVPTSGTWYMFLEDPPGGGFLFTDNDYCNVRDEFSSSIISLWFTVASRTNMGDGTQRYTCTYRSGDRTSQRVYMMGLPVVDYGASGQGYLLMAADDANSPTQSPYYSVRTWSTEPYSGTLPNTVERVRLGNMREAFGTGANDRFGIGIGDYSGGNYLSYNAESANTFRLKAGSGTVSLDADGIKIDVNDAWENHRAYQFVSGATTYSRLAARSTALSENMLSIDALAISGKSSKVWINAYGAASFSGYMRLEAKSGTSYVSALTINASPDGTTSVILDANNIYLYENARISGGLYVGTTGTAPPTGTITCTTYARIGYGLYVGNAGGANPGTGAITATSHARLGGGLYVGGTGVAPTTGIIQCTSHLKAGGGLVAGSTSLTPGAGSLLYTGALTPYKNSTTYTGYAYVPLTIPLTSTSWDGDAYSNVAGGTSMNLSTVFGLPANVKAVNMTITAKDSAAIAASNDFYIAVGPGATWWYQMACRPIGADIQAEITGIVNTNGTSTIYYGIKASGAGTMDVWIRIFGYFI
jgi:hypothetical protein